MKTLRKTRASDLRRQYLRRDFLRLERLEDRCVLSGTSPNAVNDLYHALIDQPLDVSAPAGVLANDFDAEGDVLSANLFSGPNNGTLTLNTDGSFNYLPTAGFTGTDSFIYYANDGTSNSLLAAVTLQVDGQGTPPVAADDSFNIAEDGVLNIGFSEGVLANDTDAEGEALTATMVVGPTSGTLALNADGSFTYIPIADFSGSDSFTYTASDGAGTSNIATVNITVDPVNDLPTAMNDAVTVDEDTELPTGASVLANDTDPDGDPLEASLVSDVLHGTLALAADGTFSYLPEANFHGLDGFSYMVSDGEGNSSVATVTITVNSVNDLPEAINDEFSTDEDTPLIIAAPGVLGNDTDADGDPLSASILNQPEHGAVTLNADGSFTYTPETDFHGVDGFSYQASDGAAGSEVASVTINVIPVNDAPAGTDDVYATEEDTALSIDAAAGVLANDIDADGDPLTATLVSGPANGTLTLNADGSFDYTPNADWSGADSFVYTASDGTLSTGEITVTINVNATNDAPVATADEYAVDEDVTLTIDAAAGLLANDTDIDGDALAAAVVSGPANGTLTLNADGSFSYTPNADWNGSDSFTYSVSDGALSSEATVTITVNPVSDPPIAVADAYDATEDTALTVDAAGGVLANDTDADGDPLSATLVTGPTNGSITLNSDGSFSYTPNAEFSGSDSFTYSVSDGTSTSEATVAINVAPANDAPVAAADAYTMDQDTVLSIDAATGVLANDTDLDGDPLSALLVTGPANGTLTLNADGSFEYTPTTGFSGSDSFVYKANDGSAESEATVTITVNPFQPTTDVSDDAYSSGEDLTLTMDVAMGVLANDFDPSGGTLTAALVTGPANGELVLNADGSFSYTPAANWHGTDTFVYEATSSTGGSVEATASIVVDPINDFPIAVGDEFDVPESGELSASVMGNDSDIEGDALTARLVRGPANGELVWNEDGSFTYTRDEGFTGDDHFWYQLNDGKANSAVVQVTLHVGSEPANELPASGDDAYTVVSGQTLDVAVPGVLANDTDANGDPMTVALVANASSGVLTLNPDGSFSYVPNDGFTGSDTFTYMANDGTGDGNVATVTLTVTPEGAGTPIEAADDTYSVAAETTLEIDAAGGVLANDVDPEGDPLTVSMIDPPANGTLTLNADGSFSYVPAIGFSGSDSFTYQASDGTHVSNIATATIEVGSLTNSRPIANNDSFTVESGATLDVAAEQGLLLDDSDPDGDPITAELFSGPLHGSITLNSDGSFSYTSEAGYVGLDSFVYWVFDGELHSALAAVTIHVIPASNPGPDPGEIPPPGEDPCDDMGMLLAANDDGGLLDSLADPSLDTDTVDDVIGEGSWLA